MKKFERIAILSVLILLFACVAGMCMQQQKMIDNKQEIINKLNILIDKQQNETDANNKVLKLLSNTAIYLPEGAIK